jgi:hypothetical protein
MRIKFDINKELDKKLVKEFLNTSFAGHDFSSSIIKLHPKLESVRKVMYSLPFKARSTSP